MVIYVVCYWCQSVAAHLRSFFEKVGSLPRVFIVYICAHYFSKVCAHCILLIPLLYKFPPALWADPDISARRTTNGC